MPSESVLDSALVTAGGAWIAGDPQGLAGPAGDTVTLIEGTSFAISALNGDIEPGHAQGLFHGDTRFLSTWRLRVNDASLQSLASALRTPFSATFLARVRHQLDSTMLVKRDRFVGHGMREDLVLANVASEPAACAIVLEVDADFADIFEVKEDRVRPRGEHVSEVRGSSLCFSHTHRASRRRLEIVVPPGSVLTPRHVVLDVVVPPKGEWRASFEVRLELEGEPVEPDYHLGEPLEGSVPATRLRAWEADTPRVRTEHAGLNVALARSVSDLGSLRVFDPEDGGHAVVAAGAPWFMTLFGRDALLTSWMTLPLDPSLARGTLLTLARLQGSRVDPLSEEEPGRILHEVRGPATTSSLSPHGGIYYGSIDATPLFVVVLGELHRWGGLDDGLVEQLVPHADRALAWVEEFGDRDGDGFVEYQRATDRGLRNQGWKDSFDGVSFADGDLAEPPVALAEVQGYVYAALLARAGLARAGSAAELAASLEERARRLKAAFNEAFWLADRGCYAVGLDRDKRPIDSLASNMGHCLWTGIVEEHRARLVAEQLLSPEMYSGWGIRTLATTMGAHNPVSYHNGSIWPHDNAICAAGLMRYGLVEEAQRVVLGLLEATSTFGGRLPELFCGFARGDFPAPVPYPNACAPQAWAAATPFSLLRTLLRLDPVAPDRTIHFSPALPDQLGRFVLENVPLAGARLRIEACAGDGSIEGVPEGWNVASGKGSGPAA